MKAAVSGFASRDSDPSLLLRCAGAIISSVAYARGGVQQSMSDKLQTVREGTGASRRQAGLIICCLVAITLVVFGQAVTFDFVNLDDAWYVTDNPHVMSGLTPAGARWALTTLHGATWQPVTWISFMADAEIGLGEPWAFHLTNIILHTANVVLLFLLLNAMTGMAWRSAVVAALFAVHPLRAESVAWVVERKDVLSTLFWLLTLWAYVVYSRAPSVKRYLWVVFLFVLGLMAKPMVLTLPVVMLHLDYWPLRRYERRRIGRLLLEKIPLFAISILSTIITIIAQRSDGAVASFHLLPAGVRIANTPVHYLSYLGKTLWPAKLGCLYRHAGAWLPERAVIGSALFLALACVLALRSARRHPYVAVGWFWYVITLIPVIGLAQIGQHGIADRFTYVPHMGLFILLAWGVPALADRMKSHTARRAALGVLAVTVVMVLAARAYVQVGYWQNSIALFEQTLRVTKPNTSAEMNLASALYDAGRFDETIRHCRNIVTIDPRYGAAHYLMGTLLANQARWREAEAHLRVAVEVAPRDPKARNNLGAALLAQRKPRQAMEQFEAALEIRPDYSGAEENLYRARSMAGEE